MRALLLSSLVAIVAFASSCPRNIAKVGCENARDCDPGQACQDGACVASAACTNDSECTANPGDVCDTTTGTCQPPAATTSCATTSDCPIDQFCNTVTSSCAALADGFCRDAAQCPTSTPVCSAASSNVPGRCVQCLSPSDCTNGQDCVNPGVCSGGNNNVCPPNSTANGNGGCICNPGFHQALGGPGCVANSTGEGEGEGEGGGGEGEGEGAAGAPCDPNAGGADCVLSGGPVNSCGPGNTCICDPNTLALTCILGDPNAVDINTDTCTCIDGAGEGEGEGGEGEGEGGEGEGEGDTAACNTCIDPIFNGTTSTCQTEFDTCNGSGACSSVWNCMFGDVNGQGDTCAAGDLTCCEAGRSSSTKTKFADVQSCICDPSACGTECTGVLPQCF